MADQNIEKLVNLYLLTFMKFFYMQIVKIHHISFGVETFDLDETLPWQPIAWGLRDWSTKKKGDYVTNQLSRKILQWEIRVNHFQLVFEIITKHWSAFSIEWELTLTEKLSNNNVI